MHWPNAIDDNRVRLIRCSFLYWMKRTIIKMHYHKVAVVLYSIGLLHRCGSSKVEQICMESNLKKYH